MKSDLVFADNLAIALESPESLAEFYKTCIDTLSSPTTHQLTCDYYEKSFIEVIARNILSKTTQPSEKFYSIYLLLKVTELPGKEEFMANLARQNDLLTSIFQAGQTELNKDVRFDHRGKEYFGKSRSPENKLLGTNYVRLCFEAIVHWGEKYGVQDLNHPLHIYDFLSDSLKKKGKNPPCYYFLQKNYCLSRDLSVWDYSHITPPIIKTCEIPVEEPRVLKKGASGSSKSPGKKQVQEGDFGRLYTIDDDYSISEDLDDLTFDIKVSTRGTSRQPMQQKKSMFVENLKRKLTMDSEPRKVSFQEETQCSEKKEIETPPEKVIEKEGANETTGSKGNQTIEECGQTPEVLIEKEVKEEAAEEGQSNEKDKSESGTKEDIIALDKILPENTKNEEFSESTALRLDFLDNEEESPAEKSRILKEKLPEKAKKHHLDLVEIERSIMRSSKSLRNLISPSSCGSTKSIGLGSRILNSCLTPTSFIQKDRSFLLSREPTSALTRTQNMSMRNLGVGLGMSPALSAQMKERELNGNGSQSVKNTMSCAFAGGQNIQKRRKYDPFRKVPL